MFLKNVDYFDGSDLLNGTLINNENNLENPLIILFHAFEGKSQFTLDYAKKLAANNYSVFVADMYGSGKTATTIPECFNLVTPFLNDRELVRRRSILAYQTAIKQINTKQVGAIGFCFGGMCVLELIRSGADIKASVLAHSVLAKSSLVTNWIKSSVLVLHGYQDPQVPPQSLTEFAKEMEDAKAPDWTFTFFGKGKHSFTDPLTGTFDPVKEKEMGREYNKTIANRAYQYASCFFEEQFSNDQ